jgi:hypothetical protein
MALGFKKQKPKTTKIFCLFNCHISHVLVKSLVKYREHLFLKLKHPQHLLHTDLNVAGQ